MLYLIKYVLYDSLSSKNTNIESRQIPISLVLKIGIYQISLVLPQKTVFYKISKTDIQYLSRNLNLIFRKNANLRKSLM